MCHMRYSNPNKLIIFALLLIAFAALSFAPCLVKTTHSWLGVIIDGERTETTVTVSRQNYLPLFCCIVTLLELCLFRCTRSGFILLGLFLNLIKTIVPIIAANLETLIQELFSAASTTYSFSAVGYILVGLSIVISILYIVFFISEVKSSKLSKASSR